MLDGKHLAGPTHPSLDFINHEQNAMSITQIPQPRQEARRSDKVTAFTLNRLNKDRSHLIGRRYAFQDRFLDLPDASAASRSIMAILATTRKWHVMNIRHQR
jgi:hypothetical protein